MILLKSPEELARMRESGRIVARTLRKLSEAIEPGKTTLKDLDQLAFREISDTGGVPSFLNYRGFPASVCISVNDKVVHGIPDDTVLEHGDIVGLDLGVCLNGYHADSAWTFPVGQISEKAQRLLNITRESLFQGIAKARVGNRIGDIAATIQKYVESNGYSVVRDLVGHGIGKSLHEEPSVPNFGKAGKGEKLREGMTLCIEPMINEGTWKVRTLADNWTLVTADGKLSAHFEHTIAVTADGPFILTEE